jgi:hypothetical protein
MTVSLSNVRKMHVYEIAEFIVVLVEMQDDEMVGVVLCYLSDVFIPGNLIDLTVSHLLSFFLDLPHTLSHVLLGKLIFKIYIRPNIPKSSSSSSSPSLSNRSNLFSSLSS